MPRRLAGSYEAMFPMPFCREAFDARLTLVDFSPFFRPFLFFQLRCPVHNAIKVPGFIGVYGHEEGWGQAIGFYILYLSVF